MAIEEGILLSPDVATNILTELGALGQWLQAIGVIIVVWILLQLTNFFINKNRLRKLSKIEARLEQIEKKLDKITKK